MPEPSPPHIRRATVADLAGIFAIYNDVVRTGTATFDTAPLDPVEDRTWLTARDPERHPVLIAEDGDGITGWISLSRWSPKAAYDRTTEVSVFVAERHRTLGLGRELLTTAIAAARAAGFGVVIARITGDNAASLALFESHGFEHIGTMRRCGEKFGEVLDVELLDLQLA